MNHSRNGYEMKVQWHFKTVHSFFQQKKIKTNQKFKFCSTKLGFEGETAGFRPNEGVKETENVTVCTKADTIKADSAMKCNLRMATEGLQAAYSDEFQAMVSYAKTYSVSRAQKVFGNKLQRGYDAIQRDQ